MGDFKLLPADVLVTVNDRRDPFSLLKRGLMGSPYEHVYMYMGPVGLLVYGQIIRIPMLFESDGDGVVIESLVSRYGESIVVMRLKAQYSEKIWRLLEEAVLLAQDPQSKYDYMCIVKWVLPRLILERLRLPTPLTWQRDKSQICSEAISEVFHRAELDFLPPRIVPMPADFVQDSYLLEQAWQGKLGEILL